MVPFHNKDKGFHESWYHRRDLLDIPHPFRMVLLSEPNGGKTTLILNIILRVSRTTHPFERIVIVHCDPTATQEYSDVDHDLLDRIPGADAFEPQQKNLGDPGGPELLGHEFGATREARTIVWLCVYA